MVLPTFLIRQAPSSDTPSKTDVFIRSHHSTDTVLKTLRKALRTSRLGCALRGISEGKVNLLHTMLRQSLFQQVERFCVAHPTSHGVSITAALVVKTLPAYAPLRAVSLCLLLCKNFTPTNPCRLWHRDTMRMAITCSGMRFCFVNHLQSTQGVYIYDGLRTDPYQARRSPVYR
jgi:hypothetical protein